MYILIIRRLSEGGSLQTLNAFVLLHHVITILL